MLVKSGDILRRAAKESGNVSEIRDIRKQAKYEC